MKIWVYTICWQEAYMMPFFLRHYSTFADKIIVYDEQSTDGTRELVKACPVAELRDWPHKGLNDDLFIDAIHKTYPEARGKADWVMWPDVDELLHSHDMRATLNTRESILGSIGFALISAKPPVVDDGKSQLYQLCRTGVRQENYDKWIVWRPGADIRFTVGRHYLGHSNVPLRWQPFKLLHAHFINGYALSQARNARNLERSTMVGLGKYGWSYQQGATGPSSNGWLAHACTRLTHVV